MPRGDKSSYSDKQKRQAEHIEESAKKKGRSTKTAERIAWATVNKQTGGGKKTTKKAAKKSAKKAAKKGARKTAARKSTRKSAARKTARKSAAKKAAKRGGRKTAKKRRS